MKMNSLAKENTRLGFIGVGNMGSRMAKRLLEHGYQVIVYNRSRGAAEALTKYGATVAESIAELASEADVIFSSLTNDEAVISVYTDPEGVFTHVRSDSPVSGSTPAAEEGTLPLFCGGDEELFQAAQPIFSSIAKQYFYLGASGSGTAMKLVANTLLGVGMQAIAESIALGQKEGLDRHRLLEVLSHTAVIAPAHLGKLSRADAGDYSAQFAIRLMNKDFGLVLETAAASKVSMPATAAAFQMNLAEFAEGQEEDFSAVIKLMERLARLETSDAKSAQVASAAASKDKV
jgi:3-hydroxyisobutyrate dehydrogenase